MSKWEEVGRYLKHKGRFGETLLMRINKIFS
jgi:hypothetical protein